MKETVAVIMDDGVCEYAVRCPVSSYQVENGQVRPCSHARVSPQSHGTICAQIIARHLSGIRLVSLSIYREHAHGNAKDLEIALRWCAGKDIAVVNVSCGFSAYLHNEEILETCYRLWRQNTQVFAAYSNDGLYTAPAAFPCTIGVAAWGMRNFFIPQDCRRHGWNKTGDSLHSALRCNSFACAQASHHCLKRICAGKQPALAPRKLAIFDFAQLRDVVLTDTSCLQTEGLPFPWYNKPPESAPYFLLLPFADKKKLPLKAFRRLRALPYGLICCTRRTPLRLSLWCRAHHVRYWDEQMLLPPPAAPGGVSVPILAVRGRTNTLHTAAQLTRMFRGDDYGVLLTSVHPRGYLYGAWRVRKPDEITGLWDTIQPELIIADIADRDWLPDADLSLSLTKNVCLQWEHQASFFPQVDRELYRYILQLLKASPGDAAEKA